jgi:hypothetical protein
MESTARCQQRSGLDQASSLGASSGLPSGHQTEVRRLSAVSQRLDQHCLFSRTLLVIVIILCAQADYGIGVR